MAKNTQPKNEGSSLPVLDCFGCGVCCLHMGYPAFNLPLEILTGQTDAVDDDLAHVPEAVTGAVALLDWERWREMPVALRRDLIATIQAYQQPKDGLDGACVWLDSETRLCGHHEHRPQVCRDFEIGSPKCHEWREHYSDLVNPQMETRSVSEASGELRG